MPRLPKPGGDAGNWGELLNEFLSVEHNGDGSLKSVVRSSDIAALVPGLGEIVVGSANGPIKLPPGPVGSVLTVTPYGTNWLPAPSLPPSSTAMLLLSPKGSYTKSGIVTPVSGGALRVIGDEWLIEEGTTNVFSNPYFTSDISGVSKYQPANTTVNITHDGGALKIETIRGEDATASSFGVSALPVSNGVHAGQAWTVMFDYFQPVEMSAELYIFAYRADAGYISGSADWTEVSLLNGWKRAVGIKVLPAESGRVGWGLYRRNPDISNLTYKMDNIQLEQKDHATTLCPQFDDDGNLLPGYSWNGAPHTSSSTREAALVSAPLADGWKSVYVRYHEGDGLAVNAYLTDEGAVGSYGELIVANNVATFSSNRALYLSAAVFFDKELSAGERAALDAIATDKLQLQ